MIAMLLEGFIVFALGFGISFAGSIPPSGVNLTVIQLSIEKGKSEALWFSLGAITAEAMLCFITLRFASFIASHQEIDFWIKWMAVPVFLIMGIAALWPITPSSEKIDVKRFQRKYWWKNNFTYGIVICLINPLQIPFWLVWGTYFFAKGWLSNDLASTIIFVIGAVLGTYFLFYLFIVYAGKVMARVLKGNLSGKRLIGFVFITLALIQLSQNLWEIF